MIAIFNDSENQAFYNILSHIGMSWQDMCKMSDRQASHIFCKYKFMYDNQTGPFHDYTIRERYSRDIDLVQNRIADYIILDE